MVIYNHAAPIVFTLKISSAKLRVIFHFTPSQVNKWFLFGVHFQHLTILPLNFHWANTMDENVTKAACGSLHQSIFSFSEYYIMLFYIPAGEFGLLRASMHYILYIHQTRFGDQMETIEYVHWVLMLHHQCKMYQYFSVFTFLLSCCSILPPKNLYFFCACLTM